MAAKSGKPLHAVQATVFGIPHAELTTLVLTKLGLPPSIISAIREHHDPTSRSPRDPAAKILRIADHLAHGLLLASSPDAPIGLFTEAERKSALGTHEISFNEDDLRGEAMLTTNLLARLSSEESGRLSQPLFPPTDKKILYIRHPALSSIDPIHSALRLLAQIEFKDHLPKSPAELADATALIITSPTITAKGLALSELDPLRKSLNNPSLPILYITTQPDDSSRLALPNLTLLPYPLPLSKLARFLDSLSQNHAQAA
jgi:hypothetical protein